MHANSVAILDACDIVQAHVFPYSPRSGTAAARMPQVGVEVARARAKELRDVAEARRAAWLATLVGSAQNVLVERNRMVGLTPHNARVALSQPALPGTICRTRIDASDGRQLAGHAA